MFHKPKEFSPRQDMKKRRFFVGKRRSDINFLCFLSKNLHFVLF